MTDSSGQKDPSMEEILGSIRRIISEDSSQGGAAWTGQEVPEDDDDVLELTDEVAEPDADENRREPVFGSQTPEQSIGPESDTSGARREPILAVKRHAEPSADETTGQPGLETEPAPGAEAEGDSVDQVNPPWQETGNEGETDAGGYAVSAWDEQAPAEAAPDTDASYEGSVEEGQVAEAEDRYDAVATLEEQPMTDSTDASGMEETDDSAAQGGAELLSESVSSVTTAALGELNRAVSEKGSRMKIGDGEITITDMVKDMLRPMLREWLDENLPGIVERVVKREIQKLVDRTQDDD